MIVIKAMVTLTMIVVNGNDSSTNTDNFRARDPFPWMDEQVILVW